MLPRPSALLTLLPLVLTDAAAAAPAQRPEEESTRFFALPMVRDTRELASVAEEHLAARRFPEAIASLQRILDEHPHEVLPPTGTALGTSSTYPGAAEWALERLHELPREAREVYRARYAPRAAEALARARLAPDRALLASIPRRWPLAPAAVEAWWALGDLELEAGQPGVAALAWKRAIELSRTLEIDLAPAAARLAWLEERDAARAARRDEPAEPPRADAEPWVRPLDLTPFAERAPLKNTNCLQPVSDGEVVLVGSTLRLYALDAFSGEVRWEAGPPRGWGAPGLASAQGRLFEGLNYDHLYLAPALGGSVAVAVMQQPFTEHESDQWQGIEIMTSIPERRLHAYDLATGRELWNHAPPLQQQGSKLVWDGGGTWAQRMMVAGSPVVEGERVLVPSYRMQGRIDYHVACYEIATGELLWSTQLISGQRERNMFGRSVQEFTASPLVVSGDRVIAQTELGTLAALDLFSGRILWQTTYRQITLPKTRSYHAPKRDVVWKLAPPVVVGDVVVATPSDSTDVVAVRRSDGAKVWEYAESHLRKLDHDTEILGYSQLVGADRDTLYLSGAKLSALQKPGGLGSVAPFRSLWTRPLSRSDTAPRAVLTEKTVIAPNSQQRVVLDRRDGKEIPALTGGWNGGEAGNLWLGAGAMFSLSNAGASGFFDWRAQLDRARLAARDASEPGAVRTAAELFLRRGTISLSERDLDAARVALEESRRYFARLRELDPAQAAGARRSELAAARGLADALAGLQREEDALAVLREARELAATRDDLAGVLFQEERLVRARGGARRLAVLDEIEATWGDMPLPAETRDGATRAWLAGTAGAETLEPASDDVPTGVWVALERAGERVRGGELALALDDLHLALARSGTATLARGVLLAAAVRERIARVLALPGGREAYAPLEERAASLLAEARARDADEAASSAALAAVAELYPHSRAAEDALALRMERALEARDAAAVVALARSALDRGALSREREEELLLRVARVLGERGNAELERGLLAELARNRPDAVSHLPGHGGRTLADLARAAADAAVESAAAPVLFGASVLSSGDQLPGTHVFLGALRPARSTAEGAPTELHVYATRDELLAFSSEAPGEPAWRRELGAPVGTAEVPSAFAPGRLVYGTRGGLVCVDERGEERWSYDLGSEDPRRLMARGGVVVVLTRSNRAVALDAWLGLPLWERSFGAGGGWSGPVLGPAHAVFFSHVSSPVPPRAIAVDLFRGRVTADLRLSGFDSRSSLAETAHVSGRRLIAPSFHLRPSELAAFSLDDGARAWRIEFGPDEELAGLVHSEGSLFAVTFASSLTSSGRKGGVHLVDETEGTVRSKAELDPGERVMGLETPGAVVLESPYLFTYSYSASQSGVPVRAIHLPHGGVGKMSLPIARQEVFDGRSLPMPAVSAEMVALAYQTTTTNGGGNETRVRFVDRRTFQKVDEHILGKAFDRASRLELRGLGTALFVVGRSASSSGTCLEILEPPR